MKIRILSLFCGLLLLGCADNDLDLDSFTQVSVQVLEGYSFEKKADETFTLTVSLSSPEKLSSLEVFENGKSKQIISIENSTSRNVLLDFTTTKEEAGTSKTISFLAIDESGGFGSAEVDVQVLATSLSYLKTSISLQHYNLDTTQFAFSLSENNYVTDSAQADIWLNSEINDWNKGFQSFTSTQFVKVTEQINFDELSEEAISLIYENGNATKSLVGLGDADILVAKLANTSDYVILQINQISEKVGDNSETLSFRYRKTKETAGQ